MSTEIEAVYRVVTPLFCAGAHPKSAELRAPSFKGVLRFWWRALAWSRCDGDLTEIRRQEDCLFGSAAGGRSRVSITKMGPVPRKGGFGDGLRIRPGARYLGYGILETGADQRGFLLPGPEFTVRLRTRDFDDPRLMRSLKDALIALGIFGGMGARSRRGYGSLLIRSLCTGGKPQWHQPKSIKDLSTEVKRLRGPGDRAHLPAYTALYKKSRHLLISSNANNPLRLLDMIGRELKEAVRSVQPSDRVAFGLPRGPNLDRRASPLFIHIHECGDKPVAVLSFLPARFLREGRSDISVGGTRVRQTPENQLYRPVHDFLDRLLDPVKRKEDFTDVSEVTP